MYHRYYVTPDVLIPRKSSECIVSAALEALSHQRTLHVRDIHPTCTILDLGTGSGCLLLSIIKQWNMDLLYDDIYGVGVDVSEAALEIANKNAHSLGLQSHSTWINHSYYELNSIMNHIYMSVKSSSHILYNTTNIYQDGFDVIVCNPPYSAIYEVRYLYIYVHLYVYIMILFLR